MSLEANIKALVKAAVLEALAEFRTETTAAAYNTLQRGKDLHEVAKSQPPAPVAPQTPPPAAGSTAPEAVTTYEPVGDLIKKLATGKRAQVLSILAEYGAKKGGELKAADWPAVYTKLKALEA